MNMSSLASCESHHTLAGPCAQCVEENVSVESADASSLQKVPDFWGFAHGSTLRMDRLGIRWHAKWP